jgi:hypothetical protein
MKIEDGYIAHDSGIEIKEYMQELSNREVLNLILNYVIFQVSHVAAPS